MAYLQTKIEWSRAGVVLDSSITDWTKLTVKRGTDSKTNTFEVVLKNPINRRPTDGVNQTINKWVGDDGTFLFQEDDTITIYAAHRSQVGTLSDDDILMVGDVLKWNVKLGPKASTVTIKGTDKTFALLNRLWVSSYTLSQAQTSAEIIKNVIDNASDTGAGDGVFDITATLQTEVTYALQRDSATPGIQTLRINDTAFPIVGMTKVYKPVYEWIDDLSMLETINNFDGRDSGLATDSEDAPTQDKKMRYYVDKDSNFRWFYPDDIVDYTITVGTITGNEDDVKSINLEKSTFDIVNMVIYNGGKDLYGAGTLNYFFDNTTKSKKLLMKYKPYNDIAIAFIRDELNAGNLVLAASGAFTHQGNRYDRNGTITAVFDNVSYSSDSTYNDALRAAIQSKCIGKAQALTKARGNPRWKGSIDIKGQNMSAGENIKLTSYAVGIVSQQLRILDITHQITTGGWLTSLTVEEDEQKVGA